MKALGLVVVGVAVAFAAVSLQSAHAADVCEGFDAAQYSAAVRGDNVQKVARHDLPLRYYLSSEPGNTLATFDQGNTAKVWDLDSLEERHTFHHRNKLSLISLSRDGRFLSTSNYINPITSFRQSREHQIRLFDTTTGGEILRKEIDRGVAKMMFSPGGEHFLVHVAGQEFAEDPSSLIEVFSTATGKSITSFPHPNQRTTRHDPLTTVAGGLRLFAAHDGALMLYDALAGTLIATFDGRDKYIHVEQDTVMLYGRNEPPVLINIDSGVFLGEEIELPGTRRLLDYFFRSANDNIAFNQRLVALPTHEGSLVIVDLKSQTSLTEIVLGGDVIGTTIRTVSWLSGGERIFATWSDFEAGEFTYFGQIYESRSGRAIGPLIISDDYIRDFPLPDGSQVLIAGPAMPGRILDALTGQDVLAPMETLGDVTRAYNVPETNKLFVANAYGPLRVFDFKEGQIVGPNLLSKPSWQSIYDITLLNDGQRVLANLKGSSTLALIDAGWAFAPTQVINACSGDELDDERARNRASALAARTQQLDRLRDFVKQPVSKPRRVRGDPTARSITLSQRRGFPGDFEVQSLNYHPVDAYTYASELFASDRKVEATFWMYVGQLRFRTRNQCFNAAPGEGEYALLAVMQQDVGFDINLWAGGDLTMVYEVIDLVIEWYRDKDDPFAPLNECKEYHAQQLDGITALRESFRADAAKVRQGRRDAGLENRFVDLDFPE